jgi:hypothetical protein
MKYNATSGVVAELVNDPSRNSSPVVVANPVETNVAAITAMAVVDGIIVVVVVITAAMAEDPVVISSRRDSNE